MLRIGSLSKCYVTGVSRVTRKGGREGGREGWNIIVVTDIKTRANLSMFYFLHNTYTTMSM